MHKIMIIDDETDILRMLERYFRLNGYEVIPQKVRNRH